MAATRLASLLLALLATGGAGAGAWRGIHALRRASRRATTPPACRSRCCRSALEVRRSSRTCQCTLPREMLEAASRSRCQGRAYPRIPRRADAVPRAALAIGSHRRARSVYTRRLLPRSTRPTKPSMRARQRLRPCAFRALRRHLECLPAGQPATSIRAALLVARAQPTSRMFGLDSDDKRAPCACSRSRTEEAALAKSFSRSDAGRTAWPRASSASC